MPPLPLRTRTPSPSKSKSSGIVRTRTPSPDKSTSGATPADPSAELTTAVDDLLEQLRNKFAAVSQDMFSKMDEMSKRLDTLEVQLRADGAGKEGDAGAGTRS